jgi:carboxypeptidase C (cathepsin A)
VPLSGVVLISGILDFQTLDFYSANDLAYSLFLPTYTATAWYHKKLRKTCQGDLTAVLQASRRFADGEYAEALRKGNQLSDEGWHVLARKVAAFTGLTKEIVLRADLRVEPIRFQHALLKDRSQTIGGYDSRVTQANPVSDDPSLRVIGRPFDVGWNSYLQEELKYKSSLTYHIKTRIRPWKYGEAGTNRYLDLAPRLASAMAKNPSFRVFVAHGYFDLVTPFAGMEYTLAHLGPRPLLDRVVMKYYEAGHMMYTHQPSLRKLKADIASFVHNDPLPK